MHHRSHHTEQTDVHAHVRGAGPGQIGHYDDDQTKIVFLFGAGNVRKSEELRL